MRHIHWRLIVFGVFGLLLSGCAASYGKATLPGDKLEIVLKENDFRVVESNLVGTASCSYIFGIPLGDPKVVSRAQSEIREKAGATGRPVVLVNWTEDESWTYFLIYARQKVTYTADAIEFTK